MGKKKEKKKHIEMTENKIKYQSLIKKISKDEQF